MESSQVLLFDMIISALIFKTNRYMRLLKRESFVMTFLDHTRFSNSSILVLQLINN